jgi:hypothetical protein
MPNNKPNIPVNPPIERVVQHQQQPQHQQVSNQQQSVNVSNTSSNFLSQNQNPSGASSKINNVDPFTSYQQSNVAANQKPSQSIPSSFEIDLSIYPAPHPISPLGKHLSKLLPSNEQTIRFFNELFNEHG